MDYTSDEQLEMMDIWGDDSYLEVLRLLCEMVLYNSPPPPQYLHLAGARSLL